MATVPRTARVKIPTLAAKNAARVGHPRVSVLVDTPGRFGVYGGRYVPETLMAALDELERGFECVVYMGTEDMRRQELNVFRMRLLGAEVRAVDAGSRTLKDAINEAMREWVTNVRTTHYL